MMISSATGSRLGGRPLSTLADYIALQGKRPLLTAVSGRCSLWSFSSNSEKTASMAAKCVTPYAAGANPRRRSRRRRFPGQRRAAARPPRRPRRIQARRVPPRPRRVPAPGGGTPRSGSACPLRRARVAPQAQGPALRAGLPRPRTRRQLAVAPTEIRAGVPHRARGRQNAVPVSSTVARPQAQVGRAGRARAGPCAPACRYAHRRG